jgi:hypothetical protein
VRLTLWNDLEHVDAGDRAAGAVNVIVSPGDRRAQEAATLAAQSRHADFGSRRPRDSLRRYALAAGRAPATAKASVRTSHIDEFAAAISTGHGADRNMARRCA